MPRYVCLFCGHEFEAREENIRSFVKCGECDNYWCVSKEKFEEMINELIKVVRDDTPVLDLIDGIRTALAKCGIKGRPLKTLIVASNLVAEAERRRKVASRGQL